MGHFEHLIRPGSLCTMFNHAIWITRECSGQCVFFKFTFGHHWAGSQFINLPINKLCYISNCYVFQYMQNVWKTEKRGYQKQIRENSCKFLGPEHQYIHKGSFPMPQPLQAFEEIQHVTTYAIKPLLAYVESIMTGCITTWFGNSSTQGWRRLQKMVDIIWSITGIDLLII